MPHAKGRFRIVPPVFCADSDGVFKKATYDTVTDETHGVARFILCWYARIKVERLVRKLQKKICLTANLSQYCVCGR